MKPKYKRVLLKLSGESLAGEMKHGIDFETVLKICKPIKECVDAGVEVGIVVGGGSSSSSNKNSTQATGKGGKSKHPTEPTTVNASDDEYIDYNPIKDKQIKFFLAGMGITAGCLAILAVAYAIGKKTAQKKAEKEKNHNDNTLENKTSDD